MFGYIAAATGIGFGLGGFVMAGRAGECCRCFIVEAEATADFVRLQI